MKNVQFTRDLWILKNVDCLILVPTLLRGNAYQTKIMGRSRYKFANANVPHFITCTASSPDGIALDSGFHPPGNSHNTIGFSTLCIPTLERGNEKKFSEFF
jgi:hypothetical protein